MQKLKAVTHRLPLLLILLLFAAAIAQADEDKPGYLGVRLQDLSPSMTKALQLDDEAGVLVNDVVENSPADQAGLEGGDVIINFNGIDTPSTKALTRAIRGSAAGDKVKVVVLRGGKHQTINVELGESDDAQFLEFHGNNPGTIWVSDEGHDMAFFGQPDRGFLGIVPNDLDEQLGEYFGVQDGQGVLIASVTDDSGADQAGLKAGDVIIGIGDREIDSAEALHQAMAGTAASEEITVKVLRKGKAKSFQVTLGEMPQDNMFPQMKPGDSHFGIHAPKMMMHGEPHPGYKVIHRYGSPREDIDLEILHPGGAELEQMKADLEAMKKELQEIKQEMKK